MKQSEAEYRTLVENLPLTVSHKNVAEKVRFFIRTPFPSSDFVHQNVFPLSYQRFREKKPLCVLQQSNTLIC